GSAPAQVRARPPRPRSGRLSGPLRADRLRHSTLMGRGRELFGLLPVTLLVTAGFTAVLVSRTSGNQIDKVTITYGAIFLGACLVGHLFIRARLPYADPYLYPLAALMTAFGLVEIYRIDQSLAWKQAVIFGLGL